RGAPGPRPRDLRRGPHRTFCQRLKGSSVKKLLFVFCLLCALVAVPSALADTQELLISPFSTVAGAKADTDISVFVPETAAPTAKIAVYVPAGFDLDLSGALGAK